MSALRHMTLPGGLERWAARLALVAAVVLGLAAGPPSAGADPTYQGGPVLRAHVRLVFWDPGGEIAPATKDMLTAEVRGLAASAAWGGVVGQYGDAGGGARLEGLEDVTSDATPFPAGLCPVPAGYTKCFGWSAAENDAARRLAGPSWAPDRLVVIVAPPEVCVQPCESDTIGPPDSVPCGFHGAATVTPDGPLAYAYVETHGVCASSLTISLAHELAEALTDPALTAWFDKSAAQGGEIGDLCAGRPVYPMKGLGPRAGTLPAPALYSRGSGCATPDAAPEDGTPTPAQTPPGPDLSAPSPEETHARLPRPRATVRRRRGRIVLRLLNRPAAATATVDLFAGTKEFGAARIVGHLAARRDTLTLRPRRSARRVAVRYRSPAGLSLPLLLPVPHSRRTR
ncbi:MAG: hypothetical protein E6G56_15520 [Actinobacteria bacterium]|nr:MAG: hypothetical protein E6G56_15520 [Actinomycetota bacterium]